MRVVGSTPEQEPNIELDKQRNRHLAIDVMRFALGKGFHYSNLHTALHWPKERLKTLKKFELSAREWLIKSEVCQGFSAVNNENAASASGADPFCVELIEQVEKCASRLW